MTIDLLFALALQAADTVPVPETSFEVPLVQVPGGSIKAGDREVKLAPVWMGKTEISYELFLEYFERRERSKVDGITRPSAPYEPPKGEMEGGKHAAVGLRWHSAVGFCRWLSARTGQAFRLPTEAEWEHAARAGEAGDAPSKLLDVAWVAENAGKKTHPVGQKAANAFGLHDMMGNVWEYALEPFAPGEYGPVLRGGAWNTPSAEVRFGARQGILPAWFERDPNRPRSLWWLTDARFVGFRVVRIGDAASQAGQKAYAPKIQVRGLTLGEAARTFVPVSGEIVNTGDRALAEVELLVHWLDGEGKPLLEDEKNRATFTLAYPVLLHAWHPGEHAAALKPGETRRFTVPVPQAFEVPADPEKAAAQVTALRFAD
ncbi:MAG TPA: SUMF1/EgtB/PvdO family nonheme iron enzyme [Planctomycetota bacterium]|nr:SUMF1/EgtB/PvdO family nonheme iron enzyme [Planctomycetota bacterium]